MKKVFFLLGLAMIIALGGCKKEKATGGDEALSCEITSPKDGAEFSITEDIIVTVETKSATGTIVAVTVYFDDLLCATVTEAPYTLTILSEFLTVGTHTIKAEVFDNYAAQAEASITVNIVGAADESPDFVTFADGEFPENWATVGWIVDKTLGYDDSYSLVATSLGMTLSTTKTYTGNNMIEFFVYRGAVKFFMDNVEIQTITEDANNNWIRHIYPVLAGKHTFRWESVDAPVNVDAIKFKNDVPSTPIVFTTDVTNIETSSAKSGGIIITQDAVIACGVCWNTSPNPTINDNKTIDETETGIFTSVLTDLDGQATYYLRAYATTSQGTTYGNELSFTTLDIKLGEYYKGGIVAYIGYIGYNKHGLIVATKYFEDVVWDPSTNPVDIGTGNNGEENTQKIVQRLGNLSQDYAAKLCYDLVWEGYDDWFLPSFGELADIAHNYGAFSNFFPPNEAWWSSSESVDFNGNKGILIVYMPYSGGPEWAGKHGKCNALPVRYF